MKISIGTAQFDKKYGVNRGKSKFDFFLKKQLIKTAGKFNIRTIDTATSYKNAEKELGKIGLNGFNLITKLPKIKKQNINLEKWVTFSLKRSLDKLKVKNIYGLLIHHPKDLNKKNRKTYINALVKLKEKKLVKKIGVSLYDVEDIGKILKFWKPDIIQIPYNVIDRRLEKNSFFKRIKKNKIEIHVRSIFLQGLLTKRERPKKFYKWDNLLDRWFYWCKSKNLEPFQAAYLYVKKIKEIDKVVIGFDNLKQMRDLVKINKKHVSNFPNLECKDKMLLNPYNWNNL